MSNKIYWAMSCTIYIFAMVYTIQDIQEQRWGLASIWLVIMLVSIWQDYQRIKRLGPKPLE